MRTTVEIPDLLFRRAKLIAIQRQLTLKELINRALIREVEAIEIPSRRMVAPPIGIDSTPSALALTNAQLAQLLDQDDLLKVSQ